MAWITQQRIEAENVAAAALGIRPFDAADFAANPEKYQRFETARIARKCGGFPVGAVVGLEYHGQRENCALPGEPMQPVYLVQLPGAPEPVCLFAHALGSFVL